MPSVFCLAFCLLPSALCLLSSCSNDIDLIADDSEKTYVVFGLLNTTDSLQQVKVRMSSAADTESMDLFSDPDEFMPPSGVSVRIDEYRGEDFFSYSLQAVEYSKNTGPFFTVPNTVHEIVMHPDPRNSYKLLIEDPVSGEMISSQIEAVPQARLGSPNWPYVGYTFYNEADPFNIRIKTISRVYIYLITFRIHYLEVNAAGDSTVQTQGFLFEPRYYDRPPGFSPTRESFGIDLNKSMSFQYTLNILRRIIPEDSEVDFRQLKYFEVAVWAGDKHLKNFIQLNQRFTDDRKLLFDNIENGIGVFGSCSHVECVGIYPDDYLMDSLVNSKLLRPLKFIPGFYGRYKSHDTHVPATLSEVLNYEKE